ncbi:TMM71 protein, partial [Pomatostomus ruficeps]|nr:TMM71 protein [Pomatostomus ruficeps]
MYGISHVASTPGASSTPFNGEHRHSLSQHIFPSCACAFLDDDPAPECSISPLTGSLPTFRRSPRLLSNGYYVLPEDSFLSDEEGNMTLTPSHTSVTYKENLVRVFRRRKKIRRSLNSLFSLSASSSWLSSTIPSKRDFSHVEDSWPDGCSKLEASHSDTESRTVQNVVSQMVALIMCLIISICTRYFLGGLSATLLLMILIFLLSQDAAVSSFFSLDIFFKTTKF